MKGVALCALLLCAPGCASVSHWAMTPSTGFEETDVPAAPDYAQQANWAALPGELPRAEALVDGSEPPGDVFFLHPTTYFWRGGWNAPVGGLLTRLITAVTLDGQASAFDQAGRIFAPRFRQMTLSGFDRADVRERALDLAYSDVKRAFEYYLDHYDRGRPLVLAGHSQGSRFLLRLLQDFFVGSPLRERLVAAYPVGARVFMGPVERGEMAIPICEDARQTGCLVSWRSFARGADPSGDIHPGELGEVETVCVNPISWEQDERPVPAHENLGSIPIPIFGSIPKPQPGLVGASCEDGILWINPPGGCRYAIAHSEGNYHAYDYELFYVNVQRNARQRVDAYLATTGVH